MPKIYKYQKVTDKYTTYTINDDEENRITELCTIDGDTYISVPDDFILANQSQKIKIVPVTMTDDLKKQIEENSPHIQLIKQRVREKIRAKYSIEDELKMIRNKINGVKADEYAAYHQYVESCIEEGNVQKGEYFPSFTDGISEI